MSEIGLGNESRELRSTVETHRGSQEGVPQYKPPHFSLVTQFDLIPIIVFRVTLRRPLSNSTRPGPVFFSYLGVGRRTLILTETVSLVQKGVGGETRNVNDDDDHNDDETRRKDPPSLRNLSCPRNEIRFSSYEPEESLWGSSPLFFSLSVTGSRGKVISMFG